MIFKNKYKELFTEIQPSLDRINEEKIFIKYFDNSNISHVQSGKIPLQQGWIISGYKESYGNVSTKKTLYKNYFDALLGVAKWQV
jgi:hypothetical protein